MIRFKQCSSICLLWLLAITIISCEGKPNSLDSVILDLGFEGVETVYDYTTCLEKKLTKYPDYYQQQYSQSNPWLGKRNLEAIASFNEELNELSFVQNQAAVEVGKWIITRQDISLLKRNSRKEVLRILYDAKAKIKGEVISSLSMHQIQQINYVISAHNSGKLDKSAAFSIQTDETKYEFIVVSQFAESLGETVGDAQSTLKVSRNTDTLTLKRTLLKQRGKLNYYLILIENPCSKDQKIHQPFVIGKSLRVYYRDFGRKW